MAISSTPPPISQRRSRPVNGSVEAFAVGDVEVVGAAAFSGAVLFSGVLLCFSGEVPEFGVGVLDVDGVVVGVVAGVVAGVVVVTVVVVVVVFGV
jgi:hypothetical protein